MSDDQSGETTSKRPLTTAGVVIRLGAIGVAVLCVAGAFRVLDESDKNVESSAAKPNPNAVFFQESLCGG